MYKYVLFDLDGTLTDPAIGITNSIMYAQEKMGIEVWERERLYLFIGPPLKEAFMEYFGLSEQEAIKTLQYYREYFSTKGLYENRICDGIKELLNDLKTSGKEIALATSKPQKFAEIILEYFDISKYFDVVVGATMDGKLGKKSDVIAVALEKIGVDDLRKAVMVGDRCYDIDGAKQNGIDSVGVLFVNTDPSELSEAKATYIATTPKELLEIINNN